MTTELCPTQVVPADLPSTTHCNVGQGIYISKADNKLILAGTQTQDGGAACGYPLSFDCTTGEYFVATKAEPDGTLTAACEAERRWRPLYCNVDPADGVTKPGTWAMFPKQRTTSAFYASFIAGGSVPGDNQFRDLVLTLPAPVGCGGVDSVRWSVWYSWNVDVLADGGQLNAAFDASYSVGVPTFPSFPVIVNDSFNFGNTNDRAHSGMFQVLVPNGATGTYTMRVTRLPGTVNWDSLEIIAYAWGDAGV